MSWRRFLLALAVGALVALAGVALSTPGPARADGVIVTDIAAGSLHTCAITDQGGLKCWGANGFGQLGNGTVGTIVAGGLPVDVVGLESGAAGVDPSFYHTCAVTQAGAAKCWGWNVFGQLGTTGVYCIPDDPLFPCSSVPVDVEGLGSGVAAVNIGSLHSCALTTTGGVKCWGNNNVGQLGDGTTTSRHTAADVQGLTSGVVAIAAGFDHTCALTSEGAVKCWGDNSAGAVLGAESSETCISVFGDPHQCSTTPLDVETLDSGVVALSTLGSHTCALTQSGGVKCWGGNGSGQLGDGTFGNNRRTPDDVCADAACMSPLTGVAAVSAGRFHTCALMTGGGVKCWGSNAFGALGIGADDPDERPFAVDVCQVYDAEAAQCVELLSGAAAVAAGQHTCALMEDGGVRCWGINAAGSLGIGTFDPLPHPLPLDVIGLGPKPTPTPTPTETPGVTVTLTATATTAPLQTHTPTATGIRPAATSSPPTTATPSPIAILTDGAVASDLTLPSTGANIQSTQSSRRAWMIPLAFVAVGILIAACSMWCSREEGAP